MTAPPGGAGPGRQAQLAEALARLQARIDAACAASGRAADDLTIVAVTKTYPAADIRLLAGLGVLDIGENRAADLAAKRAAVSDPLRWHFVGQIQSRHAPAVAAASDVVHSVDRERIARRLGATAADAGRRLDMFIQISLDGDPARGGVDPASADALAELVAGTDGVRLIGCMAVPPLGADPRTAYQDLASIAARIRRDHPDATAMSAGMSGDLEAAIEAGATHLRVGTALLGRRAGTVG